MSLRALQGPTGGGTPVGGTGTTNYIPRWTPGPSTLGDSGLFDNGTAIYTTTRNVGIGTASPVTTLANTASAIDDGANGVATTGLTWSPNAVGFAAGFWNKYGAVGNGLFVRTSDTSSSTRVFHVCAGAGAVPNSLLFVRGDGNVGIGTGSPGAKLEVPFTGSLAGMRIQIGSANYFNATNHYFRTLGDNNLVQISGNYIDASFVSGYGLRLPATPGNGNANTLDSYQEGTRVLSAGDLSGWTYVTATQYWTLVGRTVTLHTVFTGGTSSATGGATIATPPLLTPLRIAAGAATNASGTALGNGVCVVGPVTGTTGTVITSNAISSSAVDKVLTVTYETAGL